MIRRVRVRSGVRLPLVDGADENGADAKRSGGSKLQHGANCPPY